MTAAPTATGLPLYAPVVVPRQPVFGRHHVVVSGHSRASIAGHRVLDRGGSVVDAMIATSAVLCAVVQHATSLGGDAFILYHDAKSGRTFGVNASGPAPAATTSDLLTRSADGRNAWSFTIPGIVGGWQEIHRRFGKMPWASLFDDAIEAAEGFPVSSVGLEAARQIEPALRADPGNAALYFRDGVLLKSGDLLRQTALAKSFRAIAQDGGAAFYSGQIAHSICAAAADKGGIATAADFASYAPEWTNPIETDYRGHTIRVMPPNSNGLLFLMQLNGLSALSSKELVEDEVARLVYMARSMRGAFELGRDFIAAPESNPPSVVRALGHDMTSELRTRVIDGARPAQVEAASGTTCVAIADAHGNAISVVQSVMYSYGSAFLDPATGVLMNSRLQGFGREPGRPTSLAPGRRPPHTLNPVMVFSDGKPRYLLTTPGGPNQTITNLQVLSNLLDRKMALGEAIDAPRWSINPKGEIVLEAKFSEAVEQGLNEAGVAARRVGGAASFGSPKVVEIFANGNLAGGIDVRRESQAIAV